MSKKLFDGSPIEILVAILALNGPPQMPENLSQKLMLILQT